METQRTIEGQGSIGKQEEVKEAKLNMILQGQTFENLKTTQES